VGPHSDPVARFSIGLIAITIIFFLITTAAAGKRWDKINDSNKENKS
jgi:hypothetical protein